MKADWHAVWAVDVVLVNAAIANTSADVQHMHTVGNKL